VLPGSSGFADVEGDTVYLAGDYEGQRLISRFLLQPRTGTGTWIVSVSHTGTWTARIPGNAARTASPVTPALLAAGNVHGTVRAGPGR
jgi:hypothetical protein